MHSAAPDTTALPKCSPTTHTLSHALVPYTLHENLHGHLTVVLQTLPTALCPDAQQPPDHKGGLYETFLPAVQELISFISTEATCPS